ncbi:MAG TPA: DUF4097 family beta strand repeat-containing protein [Vicinamibacterales bacterium]|nr:DUF4097 family beta strand repeat-containing protein [Vicinamibacterales bacterium]
MTHRSANASLLACLVVSALAVGGCEVNLNSEGIVSLETKIYKVGAMPELQLDTFEGSIEVHSWDRAEVEIEIEKRAMEQGLVDEIKVSAEQQGDTIIVKVTGPPARDFDGVQIGASFSPSARLRVAIPRNSHLTARSGEGSITVEDINGKINLTTADGSVRASRLGGEIMVRSGDGSIRIDRAEGKLDLETEDGSITLEAKPSVLRARTSDGSMRMEIEPDSAMSADWDLQTADGSVTLTLPTTFNGELDAETRDGVVRATYSGVKAELRPDGDREERRRILKATLGSGGRTIRIRSGDGRIRIE